MWLVTIPPKSLSMDCPIFPNPFVHPDNLSNKVGVHPKFLADVIDLIPIGDSAGQSAVARILDHLSRFQIGSKIGAFRGSYNV